MNSEEKVVLFTKEQSFLYQQLMGQTNKECALTLHPTLPMIAYQWLDIPWKLHPPVIHRKQQCTMHIPMFADKTYKAVVTLDKHYSKNNFIFSNQTLHITTLNGNPCFTGTMQLVSEVKK